MTRVLVLGAYGLIGAQVFRAIINAGHDAIGFGRNINTAKRVLPNADWRIGDLQDLKSSTDWEPYLDGIDYVVNCAGALQDSANSNLDLIHAVSILALADACAKQDIGLIQISAIGAKLDATTNFMQSKARGDNSIKKHASRYWIIRPGLVIAPSAFGGTQLIRMLASIPYVQPLAMGESLIQTTSISDISQLIIKVINGEIEPNQVVDLVEVDKHKLGDIINQHRIWIGGKPALVTLNIPVPLTPIISKCADGLGALGWRSPLRSTAIEVLSNGITATAEKSLTFPAKSLAETLGEFRAQREDRIAARMALLMPITIAILCIFWTMSGVVGLLRLDQAATVLIDTGWATWAAKTSVIFWAIVDIALGLCIMVRRFAKGAAMLMICVSIFYLVATTLFVPQLWLDPLGPMVKVLPSIVLAIIARVMLEER